MFEQLFLRELIRKRVNVLKAGEDSSEIGELDDMTGLELRAEPDGVFERLLGSSSDCYAHALP